ncbi:MAG TPA: flagellar basal body rod protein FlgB [Magnetospirillaceae bacterium]|jgi:flagellar basal-body rod protein FlgB
MFDDLKLFAMAHRSMDWLSKRQEVVAENIANANTPKYQPKDVKPLSFENLLDKEQQPVRALATNPMHISPAVESARFETITEQRPEESKLDGNAVLLEEQTKILGDIKDQHALASNLMQASMAMFKTALGNGQGG